MLASFDPRRRYLTGPAPGSPSVVFRKRRLLAFDPRRRYLTGLGDDITAADLTALANPTGANAGAYGSSGPSQTQALDVAEGVPVLTPAQSAFTSLYNYFQQPAVRPNSPVPVIVTPSTAAAIANAIPSSATQPASWWSTQNPTFKVSNGTLVMGSGALALLVLLSGGRKR